ncbi:MAG: MgtC/SapB family protein [Planctomycetota bacterium]
MTPIPLMLAAGLLAPLSRHVPLDPLSWEGLFTTLVCGFIVGFERQIRGKPAGIRTSMMICMGTYLFVRLGVSLEGAHTDPSRIVGQVVTGIGFLGAGVMMAREGVVIGATSAAVIWVQAALGTLVGMGHLQTSVVISCLTVIILLFIEFLEVTFHSLRAGGHARHHDDRRSPDDRRQP